MDKVVGVPLVRPFSGTRRRRRLRSSDVQLLLMALPGVLLLLVLNYVPMAGLVLAFKRYRAYQGVFGSAWVGLKNFKYLFQTHAAQHITYNTILMNALFIITSLIAALIIAVCLNEIRLTSRYLSRLYQTTLFFPFVISWVIVSYFAFGLLDQRGLINRLLSGVGASPVDWYAQPKYWHLILVLTNLWKSVGFFSIVFLAGIVAINPEYFEAAVLDGASRLNQVRYIILPLLAPLIVVNALLMISRIFYADFGLFYNVPRDQGLLYPATDVIDTYVFRALTATGDVGMAAAAGLYQAVFGFLLVLSMNWVIRRTSPERALF